MNLKAFKHAPFYEVKFSERQNIPCGKQTIIIYWSQYYVWESRNSKDTRTGFAFKELIFHRERDNRHTRKHKSIIIANRDSVKGKKLETREKSFNLWKKQKDYTRRSEEKVNFRDGNYLKRRRMETESSMF